MSRHIIFKMSIKNNPYTHLLPEDVPVWERFLAKFGCQFYSIKYDVRVGNGRPIAPTELPNMQKMAIMLSQRRIDAVAYSTAGIIVIEITRFGDLKSIGQLEAYPILYKDKFQPRAKVTPLLVCEALDSDIKPILDQLGIDYVLLPE